jgi:DNA-binding response OmpR family regulator
MVTSSDRDELLAGGPSRVGVDSSAPIIKTTTFEGTPAHTNMANKILLVDDDKDLLRFMGHSLQALGYEVVHAQDGLSAISTAQQARPDLVILDLGLPGGDGFWVMERLTDLMTLLPVIVVSAKEPGPNRGRALHAGAQAFFQKPVKRDAFLLAVRRALMPPPEASCFAIEGG